MLRRSLVIACAALLGACAALLGLDEPLPQPSVDGGLSNSSSSGGSSSGAASPPDAGIQGDAETPYCAGKSGFCDDFSSGRVQEDPDHWVVSTNAGTIAWQDGGAPQFGFAQIQTNPGTAVMRYFGIEMDIVSLKLKSPYQGGGYADIILTFSVGESCGVALRLLDGSLYLGETLLGPVGPQWQELTLTRSSTGLDVKFGAGQGTFVSASCTGATALALGFSLAGGTLERSVSFDDVWIRKDTSVSP